jgi:hypothetical protein
VTNTHALTRRVARRLDLVGVRARCRELFDRARVAVARRAVQDHGPDAPAAAHAAAAVGLDADGALCAAEQLRGCRGEGAQGHAQCAPLTNAVAC